MEKLQQRYTPFDGNDVAVKFKLPLEKAPKVPGELPYWQQKAPNMPKETRRGPKRDPAFPVVPVQRLHQRSIGRRAERRELLDGDDVGVIN